MDDDRFSEHIPMAALDLPAGHVQATSVRESIVG
jgi:hypothetical protein